MKPLNYFPGLEVFGLGRIPKSPDKFPAFSQKSYKSVKARVFL